MESNSSRQQQRGRGAWWLFLAPVLASAVAICVAALLYLGNSADEDAADESTLESFSSDREDVGDEDLLEKMNEERRLRSTPLPEKEAARGAGREVEGSLRRRAPREDVADTSGSSAEVDWEVEMADSEEVKLTPEAIQEAREYHENHGVRLSAFGGPAGQAIQERLARRRAERLRLEPADPSVSREGPVGPAGAAGAGPG